MSRPTPPAYKTRNRPAYNEALKRRGSLTIWFDPEMTWDGEPTGKRGRTPDYSDGAIQTCLTMKVLFGMALRQWRPLLDMAPDRAVETRRRLAAMAADARMKMLAFHFPFPGIGHVARRGGGLSWVPANWTWEV